MWCHCPLGLCEAEVELCPMGQCPSPQGEALNVPLGVGRLVCPHRVIHFRKNLHREWAHFGIQSGSLQKRVKSENEILLGTTKARLKASWEMSAWWKVLRTIPLSLLVVPWYTKMLQPVLSSSLAGKTMLTSKVCPGCILSLQSERICLSQSCLCGKRVSVRGTVTCGPKVAMYKPGREGDSRFIHRGCKNWWGMKPCVIQIIKMAILIKGVLVLSMMGIKDCDFKITFKRLHSVCTQQTHGVRESVAKKCLFEAKASWAHRGRPSRSWPSWSSIRWRFAAMRSVLLCDISNRLAGILSWSPSPSWVLMSASTGSSLEPIQVVQPGVLQSSCTSAAATNCAWVTEGSAESATCRACLMSGARQAESQSQFLGGTDAVQPNRGNRPFKNCDWRIRMHNEKLQRRIGIHKVFPHKTHAGSHVSCSTSKRKGLETLLIGVLAWEMKKERK